MVTIRQKIKVGMALSASAETHARTKVSARDIEILIDEPQVRGGTNQGLTPTESLMASLLGCTNVITQRIAHKVGADINAMDIKLSAQFDKRGANLDEEIEQPFSDIVLDIDITTNASAAQIEAIKSDLGKFCPISKVIRGSGVSITENWVVNKA